MYYGDVRYPVNAVVLGPLPDDFLSLSSSPAPATTERGRQEQADHALAARMQQQGAARPVMGRLEVTVVRATLNKNYGMVRMDPYVRLHFGQQVFETQTDVNGAKNPVWNKTFFIYQLPKSFKSFQLEIYDERTLSDDERVAWVTVALPEGLRKGEGSDQWHALSGRMGEGLEGSIYILMSYAESPTASPLMVYGAPGYPATGVYNQIYPGTPVGFPGMVTPGTVLQPPPGQAQRPAQHPAQHPAPPPTPRPMQPVTDDDVKQVHSMFPDMEQGVVRSVLEASGGCKEAAVEALLGMQG